VGAALTRQLLAAAATRLAAAVAATAVAEASPGEAATAAASLEADLQAEVAGHEATLAAFLAQEQAAPTGGSRKDVKGGKEDDGGGAAEADGPALFASPPPPGLVPAKVARQWSTPATAGEVASATRQVGVDGGGGNDGRFAARRFLALGLPLR
jgi:hypothetical protein